MITPIGAIFLVAAILCLRKSASTLFGLLLFSALFPATSAVTFGSLWIMPYYVLAPIFILSRFFDKENLPFATHFKGRRFLIAFALLAVISALVQPFVFKGYPVYSPRLGSSDESFFTEPLVFSVGNIAQAGYMTVNLLVVLSAAGVAASVRSTDLYKSLQFTYYFLVGTIASEVFCAFTGLPFPYSLIDNTPARSSSDLLKVLVPASRLQGTCGEPSYAGLILIVFFAVYFYRYYTGKGGGWKVLLTTAALLVVRSSSALLALAVVAGLIVISSFPMHFPLQLDKGKLKRLAWMAAASSTVLLSPTIMLALREGVFEKSTTGSYLHRTTMDHYAYNIIEDTLGFGVGLGSYRASSLLASLIGAVGILGTLAFIGALIGIFRNPVPAWLRWATLAALIDMSVAIPDITQPILWGTISFVVYTYVRYNREKLALA